MERDERDDEAQVRSWRYEQGRKVGLSREDAAAFSRGNGDLGELRELIGAGCDPGVAAKIVC